MRLGTFLFGGICGAAAIMYWNRKSKNLILSSFFNAGTSVNKQANKAANAGSRSANATRTGMDRVDASVNEDQKLKKTVNEILAAGTDIKHEPSSIIV